MGGIASKCWNKVPGFKWSLSRLHQLWLATTSACPGVRAFFWSPHLRQHCGVDGEGVGWVVTHPCYRVDHLWHCQQPDGRLQWRASSTSAKPPEACQVCLSCFAALHKWLHSAEAKHCCPHQELQVVSHCNAVDLKFEFRNICTHANLSINFCNDLREVQGLLDPQAPSLLLR